MTDKPENDYRKLNIRPEQLYRLRLLAAKMDIPMIDLIERMLVFFEYEQQKQEVKS